MRLRAAGFAWFALASLLSSACGSNSSGNPYDIRNWWGGEHISMLIEETTARVEFDCAHGTVDEPFDFDDDARFDATGTVTPDTPVISPDGPQPEARPALYQGQLAGDLLHMSVTLTDTEEVLGPFIMNRGDVGVLFKCL